MSRPRSLSEDPLRDHSYPGSVPVSSWVPGPTPGVVQVLRPPSLVTLLERDDDREEESSWLWSVGSVRQKGWLPRSDKPVTGNLPWSRYFNLYGSVSFFLCFSLLHPSQAVLLSLVRARRSVRRPRFSDLHVPHRGPESDTTLPPRRRSRPRGRISNEGSDPVPPFCVSLVPTPFPDCLTSRRIPSPTTPWQFLVGRSLNPEVKTKKEIGVSDRL